MPSTSLFAVFTFTFAISIAAVISPGPVTAAILTETPKRGWQVGPLIATGHVLLELLVVILISLGFSSGLAQSKFQVAIAIGGGILLLYMGGSYLWSLWRGKISLTVKQEIKSTRRNTNLISLGVLTTISNPFWYAWWATVVPGYLVEAQALGLASVVAFYFGHISADLLCDTLLSSTIAMGRRWISPRVYQGIILITGVFMFYLGIVFIQEGLQSIQG
jgi:threonine/homoserine/homoserine lactone efflux protein